MQNIYLVSCSKLKRGMLSEAEDLYVSENFNIAKEIVNKYADNWYIVSGKYGLVSPGECLEPYDFSLAEMTIEERIVWAKKIRSSIIKNHNVNIRIIILADELYSKQLLDVFKLDEFPVLAPFKRTFVKNCSEWREFLNVEKARTDLLDKFYCSIERLWNGLGGGRHLADCSGGDSWPLRGVYFLFESDELRLFDSSIHRLVRIGTHAVTARSKSSLWNRIRTHRGSLDGKGNHRSSVFRLHVGSAIINKYGLHEKYPQWGRGQSADRDIRSAEADLENSVSEYLSKLTLLWLDIADDPSPRSDRAYIEQNSIALISGNFKPIDIASEQWLGNFCSSEAVRKSGLWNVNHTEDGFDPSFIDVLDEYIDITVNGKTAPAMSIAPSGWSRTKLSNLNNNQMSMFLEGE